MQKFSLGPFAINMLIKNRLAFRPERIEHIKQLQLILDRAKQLEATR
jgi:hypothetical protein